MTAAPSRLALPAASTNHRRNVQLPGAGIRNVSGRLVSSPLVTSPATQPVRARATRAGSVLSISDGHSSYWTLRDRRERLRRIAPSNLPPCLSAPASSASYIDICRRPWSRVVDHQRHGRAAGAAPRIRCFDGERVTAVGVPGAQKGVREVVALPARRRSRNGVVAGERCTAIHGAVDQCTHRPDPERGAGANVELDSRRYPAAWRVQMDVLDRWGLRRSARGQGEHAQQDRRERGDGAQAAWLTSAGHERFLAGLPEWTLGGLILRARPEPSWTRCDALRRRPGRTRPTGGVAIARQPKEHRDPCETDTELEIARPEDHHRPRHLLGASEHLRRTRSHPRRSQSERGQRDLPGCMSGRTRCRRWAPRWLGWTTRACSS